MRGDGVPGAPFDLVFARLLLIHMTDPVAAVRRLAALVRLAGRLVLMDYDLSRLASRPEHPALTRAFAIIAGAFTLGGKHAGLRAAARPLSRRRRPAVAARGGRRDLLRPDRRSGGR